MTLDKGYLRIVTPLWDLIDIYQGPEVFLRTFGQAPRELGILFAAHLCLSEVQNGGFEQFFYNGSGVLAPEAVEGFVAIGLPETGAVVQEAMTRLGSPYVRERRERQEALERLPEGCFRELDEKFYALADREAGGFRRAADGHAERVAR